MTVEAPMAFVHRYWQRTNLV